MTVDNRSQAENDSTSKNSGKSNVTQSRDDGTTTSLINRLIHTKWADAKISIKGSPSSAIPM